MHTKRRTSSSFTKPPNEQSPGASLSTLPPEILVLISQNLTYPDALSLKHSSHIFYNLVFTGVKLKVAWLIERRTLRLDSLHEQRCDLRTDMQFCRGSVCQLMKRRREHGECESKPGGRGCLVLDRAVCTFPKRKIWFGSYLQGASWTNGLLLWIIVTLLGIIASLIYQPFTSYNSPRQGVSIL